MKRILFLILVIQASLFYGQQGGEERPKPPKFSASDRCGIIYFESEEVAENIKVKPDTDRFYDMAKALRNYNNKVKEVAFLNSNNFKELDLMINEALNATGEPKKEDLDPKVIEKKRKKSEELFKTLPETRKKIIKYAIALNEKLKVVLKEKQYKKWLKYQKKKRKSLIPERPNANSDNGRLSRSGFGQGPNIGNTNGARGYR